MLLPVQLEVAEDLLHELAHRVGLAGRDHEVVRLVLLEHQPHRLDVVLGKAPVALGVEVAQVQLLLQPQLDARRRAGDLAGDERLAAPLGLVVEEDAVGCEQAVRLAVVDGHPVGVHLGSGVGATGVEGRRLGLRRRGRPEHLRVPAW